MSTLEIKLAGVKAIGEREFTGHGSVFNNVDLGGDIVVPGAFSKSIAKHRDAGTSPLMAWMHDPTKVPGKWISVREDALGLAVHGVLADTPLGNEAHALLKMEAIAGLSIGYQTVRSDFDSKGNRRLLELNLLEVSIVSMPMNQRAQVSAVKRSDLAAAVANVRDYEAFVRGAYGLSRNGAKRLAAKTWPAFAEAVGADADTDLDDLDDEMTLATAITALRSAASRINNL